MNNDEGMEIDARIEEISRKLDVDEDSFAAMLLFLGLSTYENMELGLITDGRQVVGVAWPPEGNSEL